MNDELGYGTAVMPHDSPTRDIASSSSPTASFDDAAPGGRNDWGVSWARMLAIGWTLMLLAGLLAPAAVLPFDVPGWIPWPRGEEGPSWIDKVIHAVLFAVETWLLMRPGVLASPRRAVGWALGLAVGTEVLQGVIPSRSADLADFVANLVGLGLAIWLGRGRETR